MKKQTFEIEGEDGRNIKYEMLFSFDLQETNKSYLVYTDHSLDEEGNTRIYASIFHPDKKEGFLEPIKTEKEMNIVQTVLDKLQRKLDEKGDEL